MALIIFIAVCLSIGFFLNFAWDDALAMVVGTIIAVIVASKEK